MTTPTEKRIHTSVIGRIYFNPILMATKDAPHIMTVKIAFIDAPRLFFISLPAIEKYPRRRARSAPRIRTIYLAIRPSSCSVSCSPAFTCHGLNWASSRPGMRPCIKTPFRPCSIRSTCPYSWKSEIS